MKINFLQVLLWWKIGNLLANEAYPIIFWKKQILLYGASERPYEFLKHYQDILFSNSIEDFKELKTEYLKSLDFQTSILKLFISDKEANEEHNKMYVPSINFFKIILS